MCTFLFFASISLAMPIACHASSNDLDPGKIIVQIFPSMSTRVVQRLTIVSL